MRLVLAVLVLSACGGTQPGAVENRGGSASTSCDLPPRLEFEARRYANLDVGEPGSQVWSAWRVGLQLARELKSLRDTTVRGTLAMVGDEIVWSFDVAGKLDPDRCVLEMWTGTHTHEPSRVTIDVPKRTGTIHSFDDVWLLGPPFPAQR
jgi:hypothetical protein